MNGVGFVLIFGVVLLIIFAVVYVKSSTTKNQLRKYENIYIGMTEEEMLSIMGSGYNRSLLKNNRKKYEWRINARSYGTYGNGFSVRSYSGVKKVTIYTKEGYVEEVKPFNV